MKKFKRTTFLILLFLLFTQISWGQGGGSPCGVFPCANGGTCTDLGGGDFVCDCRPFTSGIFCQDIKYPQVLGLNAPVVCKNDTDAAINGIYLSPIENVEVITTYTITGGTLAIGTANITFGGSGNESASFTAVGTMLNLNLALDAATFTPTPNLSGINIAGIQIQVEYLNAPNHTASVTFDILEPTAGTDTRTECNSYTWIDGNTYTASNNSATFNIVGGAANSCDSLVTLDLTIINWGECNPISITDPCGCDNTIMIGDQLLFRDTLVVNALAGQPVNIIQNNMDGMVDETNTPLVNGAFIGNIPDSGILKYVFYRRPGTSVNILVNDTPFMSEAPCPSQEVCSAAIPTLSEWGQYILFLLISIIGLILLRSVASKFEISHT